MSSVILEGNSQADLDLLFHSPRDYFWGEIVQSSELVIFTPEAPCVPMGSFLSTGSSANEGILGCCVMLVYHERKKSPCCKIRMIVRCLQLSCL
jgi:hypothetical protein